MVKEMRKALLLVVLMLPLPVLAQTDQEIFEETAAMCAAHLAIAGGMSEQDLPKMVLTRDGRWFRHMLVALTSEAEADQRIETHAYDVQEAWRNGNLTWDALLEPLRNTARSGSP